MFTYDLLQGLQVSDKHNNDHYSLSELAVGQNSNYFLYILFVVHCNTLHPTTIHGSIQIKALHICNSFAYIQLNPVAQDDKSLAINN